ncbi:BTAD domain-containing putative transcriptional regulator [Actinoplanes sp. NPDC000266]
MIEFRLLGPVELWVDGRRLEAGQPRQRAVLAVLAADTGRVVTTETLIDRLWGDTPPATARRSLHAHVTRVRRVLDEARIALRRRAGGYLLDAPPGLVDLHRMRGLRDRGRRDGLGAGERAELLREAAGLWRGEPLTGIAGPWADRMRQSWRQERLDLMLAWARAELAVGDTGEVIRRLSELAGDHPLAEPLITELIRALHGAGRSAEALERYAGFRHRLGEELGVDPGPELQALHMDLLRGSSPTPSAAPPARAGVVPAQLPASVAGFAGRAAALAELDRVLGDGGPAVIAAISGPAGVGKTSLAVHWAHRAAHRFPDGCLYVNLRGFDAGGQVLDPGEALREFLFALGVPPERTPSTSEAQAGLYRSLLAGKRVLILLDNARDAGHVRPLLPASPTVLTLVTSRNHLTPLLVTHGAQPIGLSALPVAEARELLAHRLGPGRIAAEPAAAAAIVAACAGLPLALAIVAARARHHGLSLATSADELAGARLGALDAGDTATRVETVFSWSYAALSPSAARLFRLLGPLPGPDLSAVAAASAGGRPLPGTRRDLAELVQASMLTEPSPGRYSFHDLLRAYATGLGHSGGAAARLMDHYRHTAWAATMLLDPAQDPLDLGEPAAGVTLEPPATYQQAMDWFAAERTSLLAAIAMPGSDAGIWQLALSMVTFLDWRGHWHDLEAVGRLAVAAAGRGSDAVALARAYRNLAVAHLGLNRFDEGEAGLRTALETSIACGDVVGQAFAHNSLAALHDRRDRPGLALPHARRSLELFEAAGHRVGQANALNSVGWYQALLGDYEDSVVSCRRALALLEELGDRYGQAHTWDSLGYAAHHLGRHRDALDCYQHAVAIFHDLGDRYQEADTTAKLGDAHESAGAPEAARAAWEHAWKILTDLGHPDAAALRARLFPPQRR